MGDLFGSLAKAYHEGGIGMHPILVSLVFVIGLLIDRIRVLYFSAAMDKDAFLRGLDGWDSEKEHCAGAERRLHERYGVEWRP